MANHDLLIHQPSVDLLDISANAYSQPPVWDESLTAETAEEEVVLSALEQVLELKKRSGTKDDRVHDISGSTSNEIDATRRGTFEFARDLYTQMLRRHSNVAYYGLADVAHFTDHTNNPYALHTRVNHRRNPFRRTTQFYLRLEESLILDAHKLVHAAEARTAEPGSRAEVRDGTLAVRTQNSLRQVSLFGYTFNRSATDPANRVTIPELPSCEAFIGATVLDQLRLAPAVARVIPYWMKDREIHARDLLHAAGITDVPVLSIIVGKSGDMERTIHWGQDDDSFALGSVSEYVKTRKAHKNSVRIAKSIHDAIFSEHAALFQEYCAVALDSNVAPSKILSASSFLSYRAHEFMSRTLRAAPMYEQKGTALAAAKETAQAVTALSHLFSRNFQHGPVPFPHSQVSVMQMNGVNTNRTFYIHGILASMPEVDPSTIRNSSQIDLVSHLVIEGLTDADKRKAQSAPDGKTAIDFLLSKYTSRYCLLEARRTDNNTLRRSSPVAIN